MTAWQLAIKCLSYKPMANSNICEHCQSRFEVNPKQTTKRFCTENCQRLARAERRKATSQEQRQQAG